MNAYSKRAIHVSRMKRNWYTLFDFHINNSVIFRNSPHIKNSINGRAVVCFSLRHFFPKDQSENVIPSYIIVHNIVYILHTRSAVSKLTTLIRKFNKNFHIKLQTWYNTFRFNTRIIILFFFKIVRFDSISSVHITRIEKKNTNTAPVFGYRLMYTCPVRRTVDTQGRVLGGGAPITKGLREPTSYRECLMPFDGHR